MVSVLKAMLEEGGPTNVTSLPIDPNLDEKLHAALGPDFVDRLLSGELKEELKSKADGAQ